MFRFKGIRSKRTTVIVLVLMAAVLSGCVGPRGWPGVASNGNDTLFVGTADGRVLALDADYVLSDQFVSELAKLNPTGDIGGYRASFTYCILGKMLRGSLYPPVSVLFNWVNSSFYQDGHTQRISVRGRICDLEAKIYHDDRKPLKAWLLAQQKYMKLECIQLQEKNWSEVSPTGRLRKLRILMPFIVLFYCLFRKGLILDGRAGLFYTMQRTTAECILSLYLLEGDLKKISRGDNA